MITKVMIEELLGIAISTGADFAEVFAEQERSYQLQLVDGKIDAVKDHLLCGVGIRAFCGTNTYYASTSDTTRDGLLQCAAAVAGAVGDGEKSFRIPPLVKAVVPADRVSNEPGDVAARIKAEKA